MKTFAALLSCLVLAGALSAQTPAAGAGTKSAGTAKKAEPPQIRGVEVARAGKGFLGVQIVDGTFKLSFFDEQKKPVAPDAVRAVLRWDPKYKVGKERVLLTADGDGVSLSSPRTIRPPYQFKLFITLIKEAKETPDTDEPVGESYTIDFRM
jgi:hypothetical protein